MPLRSLLYVVVYCPAPAKGEGVRLPSPTYLQTSGATNLRDSAAPTTTARRPQVHFSRNCPDRGIDDSTTTENHKCHATTGSPLTALSLQANHGLKNPIVTGLICRII